jgi:hypothetical protein
MHSSNHVASKGYGCSVCSRIIFIIVLSEAEEKWIEKAIDIDMVFGKYRHFVSPACPEYFSSGRGFPARFACGNDNLT